MAAALSFRHCSFVLAVFFCRKGRGWATWLACCFFCFFCPPVACPSTLTIHHPHHPPPNPLNSLLCKLVLSKYHHGGSNCWNQKHLRQTSRWLNRSNTVLRPSLLPLKVRSDDVSYLVVWTVLPPSSSHDLDMFWSTQFFYISKHTRRSCVQRWRWSKWRWRNWNNISKAQ